MKYFSILIVALHLAGCAGEDVNNISASGTIEAVEVTVGAKVGGEVVTLRVDEGASVIAGDTLVLLDRSDSELQLDQAKANADAAEAQYKLILRGARDEDIVQAEATLKNAEDDLNRTEGLFKEGSISQKQLDDVRTRHILATQAYEKLKRGSRPEEIDAARARRDQAVAQVNAVKKKLRDSYVTAPIGGLITQKMIEEGEVVLPNASLFRIARLDKVHLVIYVSEEELARVKLGQIAKVTIDGRPEEPFTGAVTYISSVAEFTPKNVQTKEDRTKLVFAVKIGVPNTDRILKPGMPADALIETSTISPK